MPSRSPVFFWLLLAATLCVDAVVFSRMASESNSASVYVKISFDALIVSQLSLICIWSAINSTTFAWLPALIATLSATLLTTMFIDEPVHFIDAFGSYVAPYGMHAALLMSALWLFQRTSYWRSRSGVSRGLQYSVANLLIAMTVVAVLITTMRGNPLYGDTKWVNMGLTCSAVALAVVSVFVWSLSLHWLLRLAAVLGLALLLGAIFWLTADFGATISLAIGAHYLIQAIVLSAWLGWGPILPDGVTSANADS